MSYRLTLPFGQVPLSENVGHKVEHFWAEAKGHRAAARQLAKAKTFQVHSVLSLSSCLYVLPTPSSVPCFLPAAPSFSHSTSSLPPSLPSSQFFPSLLTSFLHFLSFLKPPSPHLQDQAARNRYRTVSTPISPILGQDYSTLRKMFLCQFKLCLVYC